jgi:hypothetical protein
VVAQEPIALSKRSPDFLERQEARKIAGRVREGYASLDLSPGSAEDLCIHQANSIVALSPIPLAVALIVPQVI